MLPGVCSAVLWFCDIVVPRTACFFLAPVSLLCRCCVLVSVACVLESRNRNFVSCLCLVPLCFLTHLMLRLASRSVVSATRCLVASCAFAGIVSQGLLGPVVWIFSVSLQSETMPWWEGRGRKRWVSRPRFVRNRGAGSPFLVLDTQCPPDWVRYSSRALVRSVSEVLCEDFLI